MKKKRLIGENIVPDCIYCQHGIFNGSEYVCCARAKLRDGKCRKFDYNPTLRKPAQRAELASYSIDDFKI